MIITDIKLKNINEIILFNIMIINNMIYNYGVNFFSRMYDNI